MSVRETIDYEEAEVEDLFKLKRSRAPVKERVRKIAKSKKPPEVPVPTVAERLVINDNYKVHVGACKKNGQLPLEYNLYVEESMKDPDLLKPPEPQIYEAPAIRYEQYFGNVENL